jgi:MFS transporter, BCD family, chlorophyll transporter
MTARPLGWIGIVRLGLVQTALGAIVVLMTSTINRVMTVELAFPALIPGLLLSIHYAMQVLRPRWGYGSDKGGRRTPWIIGGMAVLALGGTGAAVATALAAVNPVAGVALAALAFLFVGMGAGAAGTSLLVLLATTVAPERRAAAASVVWIMMIAGFAITAPLAGHFLDPFSFERLVLVTAVVSAVAFSVAALAVSGVEARALPTASRPVLAPPPSRDGQPTFAVALRQVWAEPKARQFTIFIFVSMLAYSTQELILEPFAGFVYAMTPGQSTKLAGLQHGGVLLGMLLVSFATTVIGGPRLGSLRGWTMAGCLGSAAALLAIAIGGFVGSAWPFRTSVFALGVANGVFAVAAIGSMMGMAGAGTQAREGVRMGLWGAAQAVAFGLGGLLGTAATDIMRLALGSPVAAYGSVFVAEAALFVFAAALAFSLGQTRSPSPHPHLAPRGWAAGTGA